ncbi:MAG: winged helix-turn-helix domain-containing protein [Victivallaceae bacterium]|nr:winged helix-turn-helix domain-containing protein [Victivallaceae bacterium]
MTEDMKIRRYVIQTVYRNGRVPVRLPSSRELAERFQVSRSTVSLAMDRLKNDGFVSSVHGVGFFTVPRAPGSVQYGLPLIGLLYGDGKYQFYYKYEVLQLSAVAEALVRRGFNIRPIMIEAFRTGEFLEELTSFCIDGLYWGGLYEQIPVLAPLIEKKGIPVVTSNTKVMGINNVAFALKREDFSAVGQTVGDLLERLVLRHDLRVESVTVEE